MRVRYAMVCDQCQERQTEYAPPTTCFRCMEDVCSKCMAYWTDEERGRGVCKPCLKEEQASRFAKPERGDLDRYPEGFACNERCGFCGRCS